LKTAGSSIGYKPTMATIKKMSEAKLGKLGSSSPMFGKTHTTEARSKISIGISKPVTLYNNNNQYILTFKNSQQLSDFIGCHKITIGRYIKSGICYNGLYYFRINL
jgi:hypothetical protein